MQIKLFRNLKKYTLTSSVKTADIALLKKYNPEALVIKDKEGNVKFAIGYNEGKSSVAPFGITFGSTDVATGAAMVVGSLPETADTAEKCGDYVADAVGKALAYVNTLEETIPAAVADVTAARSALIGSITEG